VSLLPAQAFPAESLRCVPRGSTAKYEPPVNSIDHPDRALATLDAVAGATGQRLN
jgi:hypothetical protein